MTSPTPELIFTREATEGELPALAAQIALHLTKADPFCLWLAGEMGAGKTTLVREIMHALGLAPNVPVLSPTYTYLNEYQIGSDWFAHLDLYRSTAIQALEEAGLLDARTYRGVFAEWPMAGGTPSGLEATHGIEIQPNGTGDGRRYGFGKFK